MKYRYDFPAVEPAVDPPLGSMSPAADDDLAWECVRHPTDRVFDRASICDLCENVSRELCESPYMKICTISDLHANLEALSALPCDYEEQWVLGDLVNYGPNPVDTIDFVRSHASMVVRGNHDHSVGFGGLAAGALRALAPWRKRLETTRAPS
jgi:hypothetical protein